MESEVLPNHTDMGHKPISELLPLLSNLLSQDALQSTRKTAKGNAAVGRVTEKFKPLTMAEIKANIDSLNKKSTKEPAAAPATQNRWTSSVSHKRWNSSVKVDKKSKPLTEAQPKNNPVRKVLNFQQRSYPQIVVSRPSMFPETSKFPKPEARAKKSVTVKARETIRISGVYKIPETPVLEVNKPKTSRLTIANKENYAMPRKSIIPTLSRPEKKQFASPKPVNKALPMKRVPDTPMSNDSWKSSCDASFLQKEKESEEVDNKITPITEEGVENIATVSPPVSTPFKEYRNVEDYFNHSSDLDETNENTIMCFDKTTPVAKRNDILYDMNEETVASLCDLFQKATVTNPQQNKSDLDILHEMKSQTESNITSQIRLLNYINYLIKSKATASTVKNLIQQVNVSNILVVSNENLAVTSPALESNGCLKKHTPTYKIPRKSCLKRKVFHKSMPEMSRMTPKAVTIDSNDQALDMYIKMKQNMDFLNTPKVKQQKSSLPDTPAMTKHNLQRQLDKLFNGS